MGGLDPAQLNFCKDGFPTVGIAETWKEFTFNRKQFVTACLVISGGADFGRSPKWTIEYFNDLDQKITENPAEYRVDRSRPFFGIGTEYTENSTEKDCFWYITPAWIILGHTVEWGEGSKVVSESFEAIIPLSREKQSHDYILSCIQEGQTLKQFHEWRNSYPYCSNKKRSEFHEDQIQFHNEKMVPLGWDPI